jgi:AcrR family transcriptional regulator
VPDRHPTARRLIDRGLRLFAENGIAGTPIVRIEEAAGLAPSSGAFYRHFKSKADLLAAAVDDAAASTQAGAEWINALDGLSLEDQVVAIARGAWFLLDAHRDLVLVLTRDTHPKPANYGYEPTMFPGGGPSFIATWLRNHIETGDLAPLDDPEATALVLADSLTTFWLQREAEDPIPYGIDSDRFITAWADLVLRLRPPPRTRRRQRT